MTVRSTASFVQRRRAPLGVAACAAALLYAADGRALSGALTTPIALNQDGACDGSGSTKFGVGLRGQGSTNDGGGTDIISLYLVDGNDKILQGAAGLGLPTAGPNTALLVTTVLARPDVGPFAVIVEDDTDSVINFTGTFAGVAVERFEFDANALDPDCPAAPAAPAAANAADFSSQSAAVAAVVLSQAAQQTTGLIADAALAGVDPIGDLRFGSGSLLAAANSRRAAGAAGQAATQDVGVWAKAAAAGVDVDRAGADVDATTFTALVGADVALRADVVAGAAIGLEWVDADIESTQGRQNSRSIIFAPYAAWRIRPGLSVTGSVGYQSGWNEASVNDKTDRGEFRSDRLFSRVMVQGAADLGDLRAVVDAGAWYAQEWQGGYTTDVLGLDVPSQSFSVGRSFLNAELAMPILFDDAALEPFAVVGVSYDLTQAGGRLVNGTTVDGDRLGGRAGAGLRFEAGDGPAGEVGSAYESVGRDDENAWTGRARLRWGF